MKKPILRKSLEIKKCHNFKWKDYYSWIHQKNILEVLKDSSKLNSEVKKYLEEENKYADFYLRNTKNSQKKLFKEIKGRIKLDDKSLPFKDDVYEYWIETTKKGNYSKSLRKKIGTNKTEIIWDGDKEKKKIGSKFFGIGDSTVSYNDQLLAYSLDTLGSEYFTIYVRSIKSKKLITEKIEETSGAICFSLDDKYIFYSKLGKNRRAKKIYRHEIGKKVKDDKLILEEKDEKYDVGISGHTSDKKFFLLRSSDGVSDEKYYFSIDENLPKPKLFKKRKKNILYSIDSWDGNFYIHTNENAEDFKVCKCSHQNTRKWKDFIPAKEGVLIGGVHFLKNWMFRGQARNALGEIYVRNLKTNKEKKITVLKEKIENLGLSRCQKDRNTDLLHLSVESPRTPNKTYLYNLKTDKKKLLKKQEIPSGYNQNNYIVERLYCKAHDGEKIPITIIRHKKTKLNENTNLLLYGYGSYGSSSGTGFSTTRLSLINRDIVCATAHIRGGLEKGMKWWKNGKMLKKKNTFKDYISVANFLIKKKYTGKGKIIGLGGSAGGLLMGAVVNKAPELFLGMIMAVPFVDSLTTNLDHSLPLTAGEFDEFGNAKKYKSHFKYIYSYAPYNNIKKIDYPHIFIRTSLSDFRVLFDEPTKFTAKLREYKTDDNLLLLKTEMDAGHSGQSGRDGSIEDVALDYSFILKISGKLENLIINKKNSFL